MLHRISKMLMAEADGSPGGGAPTPEPTAESEGQAQGQGALTLEAIAKLMDEKLTARDNRVFAETRRIAEGIAKSKGTKPTEPTKEVTPAAAPQAADMRAFDRATRRIDISDSQLARMERAYAADAPNDPTSWVAEYLNDLGIKPKESGVANDTNNTNPKTSAQQRAPVTAAGSPASSQAITEDTPLFEMSQADRDRLIKKNGLSWYVQRLERDAKGRRFRTGSD